MLFENRDRLFSARDRLRESATRPAAKKSNLSAQEKAVVEADDGCPSDGVYQSRRDAGGPPPGRRRSKTSYAANGPRNGPCGAFVASTMRTSRGLVVLGHVDRLTEEQALDLERVDSRSKDCHIVRMAATTKEDQAAARRSKILLAARWCFLNFGFAKTSFEDIAKRANLSRTLLYRVFKDKEDIFRAVFVDWLVSRHPAAKQAVTAPGSPYERLLAVCRLMVLDPWAEMVGTPMGREFFDACERIDPEADARHRRVALECITAILGDEASAEVFLLSLDGLLADEPTTDVLEQRVRILAARFASPANK
ncbi:MAG: TetR/AcrR family transcriptional regulator [Minicystis sp.]